MLEGETLAYDFCKALLLDIEMQKEKPSKIAAASIYCAMSL